MGLMGFILRFWGMNIFNCCFVRFSGLLLLLVSDNLIVLEFKLLELLFYVNGFLFIVES